jgi:uncharacterized protein YaiI (UPF0178 family)
LDADSIKGKLKFKARHQDVVIAGDVAVAADVVAADAAVIVMVMIR